MKPAARAHLDELLRRYPALSTQEAPLAAAAEMLIACYRAGGKILTCGNGGSAADAEHIVGELMKGFCLKRPLPESAVAKLKQSGFADAEQLARNLQQGLPAISLAGHAALSTAVLNDNDPHMTFAQQVYALGRPGDVLVGLSTSGNSKNVINAFKVAKAFGLKNIGLCGTKNCHMDEVCECVIHAPESETYKVQELHLPVYHALCLAIEAEMYG